MKKLTILLTALLLAQATWAVDIKAVFDEFKDTPRAEYVSISPFLMKIGKCFIDEEDGPEMALAKQIRSMKVLDLEDCDPEVKARFTKRIADLNRLPAALFVVDVMKEQIAVREANRLGIPVFAMVDTNSDPRNIDFVIPANDDASKSIEVILDVLCNAMAEGIEERKIEKIDEAPEDKEAAAPKRERKARIARRKTEETLETEKQEVTETSETSASDVEETPAATSEE